MALTESASYSEAPGKLAAVPIAIGETIFDGALVGMDNSGGANTGRAINWRRIIATGVDPHIFLGVARVSEVTGIPAATGEAKTGTTAGDEEVFVDISGVVLRRITVAATTIGLLGSLGAQVFANDENTFTVLEPVPGLRDAVGWITRITVVDDDVDVQLFTPDEFRARLDV